MTGGDAALARARAFVDELARIGVRHACLAPGSRSTPLVLAVATDDRIRSHVHLDERSAAFFALGLGKATGRAAAVITTSGTALANLHPAVMEADHSRTPLLLLTADRPHRLRGTDANQTVDQQRFFGRSTRAFLEAAPTPEPDQRRLRALAARAEWATRGIPPGPVQVNFPFDKPLQPASPEAMRSAEAPAGPDPGGEPSTAVSGSRAGVAEGIVARLAEWLATASRPLLVAGPLSATGSAGSAAIGLARAAGAPLLADPLSGARFAPGAREVCPAGYDLFVGAADGLPEPDLVLRLGPAPTSAAVQDYLAARSSIRQVVVDAGGRWMDHAAVASDYLHSEPGPLCRAVTRELEARSPERERWPGAWLEAGRRAREAIGEAVRESLSGGAFFEGAVLHELSLSLPEGCTVVVGSSMPVRDLDAFGIPRDERLRVVGNRGASGIDGFVSTALGVAAAGSGPVVAVCGDLSFYHDLNGLLAARELPEDVTFVVINNDGGGIFHMLPIRDFDPPFTEMFATPHGLDFSHAARLYGLPHRRIGRGDDLTAALSGAGRPGSGVRIMEVASRREGNRERREQVAESVRDAVSAPADL